MALAVVSQAGPSMMVWRTQRLARRWPRVNSAISLGSSAAMKLLYLAIQNAGVHRLRQARDLGPVRKHDLRGMVLLSPRFSLM